MPLSPMNPEDSDSPKEVIIKQAEGGFIITKLGGGRSFNDKPIVATKDNFDDAINKCKKWLLK